MSRALIVLIALAFAACEQNPTSPAVSESSSRSGITGPGREPIGGDIRLVQTGLTESEIRDLMVRFCALPTTELSGASTIDCSFAGRGSAQWDKPMSVGRAR
jgi:hypothetical protein